MSDQSWEQNNTRAFMQKGCYLTHLTLSSQGIIQVADLFWQDLAAGGNGDRVHFHIDQK